MLRQFRMFAVGVTVLPLMASGAVALGQPRDALQPRPGQSRQDAPDLQDRSDQLQPGQRGRLQQAQPGRPGQPAISDQELAGWVLIDNRGEIQLAQFALEKTESPAVRQFAQRMIQDHQRFAQQLAQAIGGQGLEQQQPGQPPARDLRPRQTRPDAEARQDGDAIDEAIRESAAEIREAVREAERAVEQAEADDEQDQPRRALRGRQDTPGALEERQEVEVRKVPQPFHGGAAAGGQGWLGVKQRLAQQMVEAIQNELQDKQGAEFDVAFMSGQTYRHLQALNTLQVFQQLASPELKPVLEQGARMTQEHLEMAKAILRQVEQREQKEGAETPDRQRTGGTSPRQKSGTQRPQ